MREIIFRGKRIDNGCFVYGDLIHYEGKTYIDDCLRYEVDPATVGQYTGVGDKFWNGIFEGDIVKWDDHSKGAYWRVAEIYYDRYGRLCYKFTPKTTTPDLIGRVWFQGHFAYAENTVNELEIIGNRWDNPDLLEP